MLLNANLCGYNGNPSLHKRRTSAIDRAPTSASASARSTAVITEVCMPVCDASCLRMRKSERSKRLTLSLVVGSAGSARDGNHVTSMCTELAQHRVVSITRVNLLRFNNSYTFLNREMKPKTSDIWQYFIPIGDDYATCKTCLKNYSRKGRTTTSLRMHLKSMHKETYKEFFKLNEQKELAKVNQTSLQQTKMQTKEDGTKKSPLWNITHGKAKKMDDLIGEMIALQNLPFNFVEDIGFRRVMKTALPNYQLRGSEFFADHICDKIYTKVLSKTRQMLKQFPKLSFTTDIWSEPCADTSLLSLTAHGITEDYTRIQIVLECCTAYNRHIGDTIWDHFNMMLLGWGIDDEQLHCFIHGGDSNMTRAMHMADKIDVNCTVRQLQQCVRSVLEDSEVKELIAKCKRISAHFIHSQIAHDELINIQTEQLNEPALRVIQDCGDRYLF